MDSNSTIHTGGMCQPFKGILWVLVLSVLVSCASQEIVPPENPFRQLMATMDWGTDTCFVYGHKTPDVDAVCSSLAYAELMCRLGYNCKAKVSSKTNNETRSASNLFDFDLPAMKPSVEPGTRLIATDHEEYIQSVDGAREGRVLQIIDHHQEGDMASVAVPFIYRKAVGSTCTLVWQLYREANVPVSDDVARILLAGMLSDTSNLTKSNVTYEDHDAWNALTTQLNLSPERVADIHRIMEEAQSNYDGMSDYDIFISDYKDYDMSGTPVGIGCVEWKDYASMDAFINRMLAVMPEAMVKKERAMMFCMATRYEANPDPSSADKVIPLGTYILYTGEGARELAEQAFGESLRDGVCYSETRLSRKSDVVPLFTRILSGQ